MTEYLGDVLSGGAFDGVLAVLSASLVAIFLERRWSKRRAVFNLTNRYLEISSLRATVQGIFDQVEEGRIEGVIAPHQVGAYSEQVASNRNAVIGLADFYEVIAAMFLHGELDDALFSSVGLRGEVDRFRQTVNRINNNLGKGLMFELEEYWPNLYRMS